MTCPPAVDPGTMASAELSLPDEADAKGNPYTRHFRSEGAQRTLSRVEELKRFYRIIAGDEQHAVLKARGQDKPAPALHGRRVIDPRVPGVVGPNGVRPKPARPQWPSAPRPYGERG